MFRTLKIGTAAALVATAGLLTSCLEAPDYPIEPRIDFKELRVVRYSPGGGFIPTDTIKVTVDFTDGDGDLGLSTETGGDINAPYNPTNPDGTYNRTTHNYFITPYVRRPPATEFSPVILNEQGGFNSRFPKLYVEGGKPSPLKGTLTLDVVTTLGSPFRPGDEVRFEVSIMDRALHESNKITTSSYTVQPR
ncbi:hypothetical protein [Hymenobacter cellulosivorans]|uniref:Lipoprotein n=1 Tax=Hymenobacter cellulosivorans TaxID=2932249 RepID=A0ABY4F2T3_9BACT|nr:hypothetical protein [Hymenobacter cellulosivorans]UOQ50977.1 hypothetical protein MUN80_14545 [Hymenobacter cellulosivorans]